MIFYKLLLVNCLHILTGYTVISRKSDVARWVVSGQSSLKVSGSTNINKFNCVISIYRNPDTLTFYKNSSTTTVKLSGLLDLNVQDFDCHNFMMTKDLRKTLKFKEHPDMFIEFVSLSRYPDLNKSCDYIDGLVIIELAGVKKQFKIDYKFTSTGNKSFSMLGRRQVKFSDFKIDPPRKAGGIVQTLDELEVEFNLGVTIL